MGLVDTIVVFTHKNNAESKMADVIELYKNNESDENITKFIQKDLKSASFKSNKDAKYSYLEKSCFVLNILSLNASPNVLAVLNVKRVPVSLSLSKAFLKSAFLYLKKKANSLSKTFFCSFVGYKRYSFVVK